MVFSGAAGPNVPFQIGNYYHPFQVVCVGLYVLGQSCGMPIFFFMSGYFSPGSLQKKGPWIFVYEKVSRLGIPFVFHVAIFGSISKLLNPNGPIFRFPVAGVTWFLAWLIILSMAYLYRVRGFTFPKVGSEPPKNLSFGRLYSIGAIAGLINGAIMVLNEADEVFQGGRTFIMMPTTYGSLPFYILFF